MRRKRDKFDTAQRTVVDSDGLLDPVAESNRQIEDEFGEHFFTHCSEMGWKE